MEPELLYVNYAGCVRSKQSGFRENFNVFARRYSLEKGASRNSAGDQKTPSLQTNFGSKSRTKSFTRSLESIKTHLTNSICQFHITLQTETNYKHNDPKTAHGSRSDEQALCVVQ